MVPASKRLEFVPLHETFGAECRGVNFKDDLSQDAFAQVKHGLEKYGVLVFRKSGMSDDQLAALAYRFGEVDVPRTPSVRLQCKEVSDASNINKDGTVVQEGELQYYIGKATAMFHVDNSYDPRRVRYTMIKAAELPPPGTGGATEFADTRTAYDDLDDATKELIQGKIAAHSIFQSRRAAVPDYKTFKAIDPMKYPMGRHYVSQKHAESGRMNLYLAYHIHHIEDMEPEASSALVTKLLTHATQKKYVLELAYKDVGDVAIWDNTAVMHRAGPGSYFGKYRRDMRRCTVFDSSEAAYGFNDKKQARMDAMKIIREVHSRVEGKDAEGVDWD